MCPDLLNPVGIWKATNIEITTLTGTQNNLVVQANTEVLRCQNATPLNITGIAIVGGNISGRILTIINPSASDYLILENANTGSLAENRIDNGTGDIDLPGDSSCVLWYDSSNLRWRVLSWGLGDNVQVNGSGAHHADFRNLLPAAPANSMNVAWQRDSAVVPNTISAYIPYAAAAQTGIVSTVAQTFSGEKTFQDGLIAGSYVRFSDIDADTTSTKTHNWTPSGWSATTGYCTRWNGTTSTGITGLTNGIDGREWLLINASTDYLLWLENENTNSTAANRFMLPDGRPAFLMPGDSIVMFYDNTATRWRVKSWTNKGAGMGLHKLTDFLSGLVGSTTISTGELELINSISGTGASIQPSTYLENTTEKPLSVIQLDTGTTATAKAEIFNNALGTIIPTLGAALCVSRLALEVATSGTETYSVITGFGDGGSTNDNGAVWEYRWTGSVAEWSQTRLAATVATRSNTGSPTPTTNYVWLVIFINAAWTRVDFIYSDDSISFTLASSPTTGLPSSTQKTGILPAGIYKTVGTTQRNVNLDLYGYRYDYVRG